MAKKKAKKKPVVAFTSTQSLVIDVDPDLPGTKSWKVKLQRKAKGKWRKVGIVRTQGATETVAFQVPEGRYRVKVYARPGYRSVTTRAYRFLPTAPSEPGTPTPPGEPSTPGAPAPPADPEVPALPAPSDTTAPGPVTGLAVVGRTATSITLSWTNPPDADLAEVVVRRAVGPTAPGSAGDGLAVPMGSPTAALVTDPDLAVDTAYAYSVFARDALGNTSAGAALATRTLGPSVVATSRVSVRSDGGQGTYISGGEEGSVDPAISADGRWISYSSWAMNLVDNDTNGIVDVFLHDRDTATTQRISVRSNGDQATGDWGSSTPAISADGHWITYASSARNLVDNDTNDAGDVFLYDRLTATTQRISVRSDGGQASGSSANPAISADGRWISYSSYATNLVDNDTNNMLDVFLYDRLTATTQRISVRSNGTQASGGFYGSGPPSISADGRWISFPSYATNLVDNDTNDSGDVFLYDRLTATTQRISVRSNGAQATRDSSSPAISADGRWITYNSDAPDLVDNDTNDSGDVFLYDRDTGTTRRVSVHTGGAQASGDSGGPTISDDGRWISYSSYAPDLVDDDSNSGYDVFLHDRDTTTTRRISLRSGGAQATGACLHPAISADGRLVVYDSFSADLVDNDTNEIWDVFLTRLW